MTQSDPGAIDAATTIQRIAAFSDGGLGGNPAGVWIGAALPPEAEMQRLAREVGFSETAFAAPLAGGAGWRVRYFSPASTIVLAWAGTPRLFHTRNPFAPACRHSGGGRQLDPCVRHRAAAVKNAAAVSEHLVVSARKLCRHF